MDAAVVLRRARVRSGLTLRALARRAGTSHATLSAYETGRVVPSVDTVDRIVRAAGFALEADIAVRIRGDADLSRGDELVQVLELAAMFPARHEAELKLPRFGSAQRPAAT